MNGTTRYDGPRDTPPEPKRHPAWTFALAALLILFFVGLLAFATHVGEIVAGPTPAPASLTATPIPTRWTPLPPKHP